MQSTGTSSFEIVDARTPELAISGVVPIVRRAILFRHDHPLTDSLSLEAFDVMQPAWREWKETYCKFVAKAARLPSSDVGFAPGEYVRLKKEASTAMLDLPRIHGIRAGDAFDMRSCWALCFDEFSSKTWTRVGPPLEKTWTMLPPESLSSVVGEYRAVAKSCGEWIHREFRRLTQAVLGTSRRGRTFEITTVGLRVNGDVNEDLLDEWLFAYDKDGAESPNFENASLCHFLADAASLDFHPRELEERAEGFWMSIPGAVELANGDVVSRRVLYLVRPTGRTFVQVVGVGLDDSRAGDLAPEVVLKASRLLAGGV